MVVNNCSVRLSEAVRASVKLNLHCPVQAGTANPRRVLTLWAPLLRETSAMLVGKGFLGESSLITAAISGRMTVARGVRSGSAKPEAKVERMEIAAMRVNFMVGKR